MKITHCMVYINLKMFNGDFIEFIGEYTLINDKKIYFLFKKIFPKFKEIRNTIYNKNALK